MAPDDLHASGADWLQGYFKFITSKRDFLCHTAWFRKVEFFSKICGFGREYTDLCSADVMKICSAKSEITESPPSFKESLGFFSVEIEQVWFKHARVGKVVGVGRGLRFPFVFSWAITEETKRTRRKRWQLKRHKTRFLMSESNCFARALYIFVHFFAVHCKTTTWID